VELKLRNVCKFDTARWQALRRVELYLHHQVSPGPAELALRLVYLVVVDRGIAALHQAILVELPKLIAMPLPPVCNAPPRRHAGRGAGGRAGAGLTWSSKSV